MKIEYFIYIATFIISTGIASLGIMLAYQNLQIYKQAVLSLLLYQQIFLISFFTYGIWGNMVLHEIISDLNLSETIANKLSLFSPIIGIPFLVVSWFMLLQFCFNSNGYKVSRGFIFSYFPLLLIAIFILSYSIHKEYIAIPADTDLFIIRILAAFNLIVHLILLLPFIFPAKKSRNNENHIGKRWIFFYVLGVVLYSLALSFFNIFDYISTSITIILLFAVSVSLPVIIKFTWSQKRAGQENIDFIEFCKLYEISKRESEIILEICSGHSNKSIAEKLFITLQTVKDHNHRIYTKTVVKSRVQLANLVREKTGL